MDMIDIEWQRLYEFLWRKWVGISFYLESICGMADTCSCCWKLWIVLRSSVCLYLDAVKIYVTSCWAKLCEHPRLRHVWLLTSLLPRSWSSWLFWRAFICRWNLCWSEQSCSRYWQILLLSVWNRCLIPSDVFWRQIFFFFRMTSKTFKWKWEPTGLS